MDKKKNTEKLNFAFEREEKLKRAEEILIANKELTFQIAEKQKQVDELLIANKKLAFLDTEQKSLFAAIVNSSDDAIVTKTLDGIITSWNLGAEKIFGYSANEIIGKHISILIPAKLQNEEVEIIKKIRQGEKVDHYETERIRKDGSVFNASITISPIKDFKGHITGASKILRNITEPIKTARELNHFRALIENNQGIISLTDDTLQLIYRSPSSTRITGWTAEEMKAIGGINYFHPDDIIIVKNAVTEAIKKPGTPQSYLARYKHKNGHYIWLEGMATKLPAESIIQGLVFNAHAVTERVELDQLLSKANTLARIGNWDVDLIKQTVYWSDITREIHETESSFVPDLATGLNFYKEGTGRDLIIQKVKEAIELGKPWDEELEIVTAKNNIRWIRTIGETEFVDGKCVKLYGSFQDINQRKKAEEKLIESVNRYRRLFDTSPIAITEEDHTPFYEKIESLRASGISKNYATYFDNHSEELYEMLGRVQILAVNQSLLDLTGAKNLEDFVANRSSFFVSMTENTVFKLMDLIRDGGGYFEEESKIKSLSGEIKEVVVRLKYPAAPPYNSVAITMRDVTKQKESEQKIKESEEKYRALVTASSDIVYRMNSDWTVMYQLDGRGFIADTIKPNSNWFQEYIHPNDQAHVMSVIKEAMRNKSVFELEHPVMQVDGTLGWTFSRAVPLFDSEGDIVEWFGAASDITARKKAEEEIRVSENRTRKIFDSDMIGFIFWDANGEILNANDRFLEMTGYTKKDLLEQKINWSRMTPPEYAELDRRGLEQIALTGISQPFEKEYIRKDGSLIPVLLGATGFEGNSPEKGVAYVLDITERKKAEKEIIEYKLALDQSSIVAITNQKGIIKHVNENFCKISKYSASELIGQDHRIINSGYHPKSFIKNLWVTIANGKIWRGEMCNKAKDGSIYWVDTTIVPLFDEHGKPNQYIAIRADITERKKAESQLVDNENYLRTILENEPECVKVLNSKGELLSMNPAGLAMIEADNEQQVLGQRMTDLVNKKYRIGFNRLSKEVFKGNSGTFEFEVTGLKGSHRWLETHAVPLKDVAGKIINLLGVTRDITERKKAETQIIKTTDELRQLTEHLQTIREEERQRIAREIHDDLGQQLTAIKMDTVWIDKQIPAETVAVKNKLQSMLELLDGSHQSVRKILNELRPAALDDNGLLEALQWQGRQFTEITGIPLRFKTNLTSSNITNETATCIFRVYQESLTNIMRYAHASVVVSSLNCSNESMILTVKDDGKGFDTALSETKKRFGLLGMKERVIALNGKFDLVSSPGKGTKIIVSLPYKNI